MTADPHGLRALADAQRRGADRLTLLRLRLANTLAGAVAVPAALTRTPARR